MLMAVSGIVFIPGEQLFLAVVRDGAVGPVFHLLFRLDGTWYLTVGAMIVLLAIVVGSAWIGRVLAAVLPGSRPGPDRPLDSHPNDWEVSR